MYFSVRYKMHMKERTRLRLIKFVPTLSSNVEKMNFQNDQTVYLVCVAEKVYKENKLFKQVMCPFKNGKIDA